MAENDAQAVIDAAKGASEHGKRLDSLEARVKQLESFLGHIHPETGEKGFQEYPKAVGDFVAWSKEEEAKLLAEVKAAVKAAS